jgi:hypothetical protein
MSYSIMSTLKQYCDHQFPCPQDEYRSSLYGDECQSAKCNDDDPNLSAYTRQLRHYMCYGW